jgi:hypothetical protein
MYHQFNPGMEVTFAGLREPLMTIVSINAKAEVAICQYYDDYAKKTIKLKCDFSSLQPAKERSGS